MGERAITVLMVDRLSKYRVSNTPTYRIVPNAYELKSEHQLHMSYSNISAPGSGVWRDELLHYLDPAVSWTTNVWAWTAIAFLFAALAYLWAGQRSDKKTCYPYPLPPRCDWGLFETLERFNSIHFHEDCLYLSRNQGKILELNLWPLLRVPISPSAIRKWLGKSWKIRTV
jgi:hypothetical protein